MVVLRSSVRRCIVCGRFMSVTQSRVDDWCRVEWHCTQQDQHSAEDYEDFSYSG